MGRQVFPLHGWGVALAAAMLASACASTRAPAGAGSLDAQGPVTVSWQDPAGFSELTFGAVPLDRGTWIRPLAQHLRHQAERLLPPGHRLDVELLDVDRAGEYEPGRHPGIHEVRVVRDLYPPRIHLRFRHFDGQGSLVAEGERRLVDGAFLQRSGTLDTDPLRFEKRLLDDWLRRELGVR